MSTLYSTTGTASQVQQGMAEDTAVLVSQLCMHLQVRWRTLYSVMWVFVSVVGGAKGFVCAGCGCGVGALGGTGGNVLTVFAGPAAACILGALPRASRIPADRCLPGVYSIRHTPSCRRATTVVGIIQ